ncbi:MAG: Yellowstone Lake virophage 5, partial [Pseudomonadota bacterium]
MSTTEVSKVAVVDPRIIQTQPTYAVEKGAVSLTNGKFSAIANSSSSQTYNVQVPSENVFVDRAVDWTQRVNAVISLT